MESSVAYLLPFLGFLHLVLHIIIFVLFMNFWRWHRRCMLSFGFLLRRFSSHGCLYYPPSRRAKRGTDIDAALVVRVVDMA
jgi:hypothetical protein